MMSRENVHPQAGDGVLGGSAAPAGRVVLGGLPGLDRRLQEGTLERRLAVLPQILAHGRAGLERLARLLKEDPAWQMRLAAFYLLQERLPHRRGDLDRFHPYALLQRTHVLPVGERESPSASFVTSVAFSPDGLTLACATSRRVSIWTVADGECLRSQAGGGCAVFGTEPQRVFVGSGWYDGAIACWDWQADTCLQTLVGHGKGAGIAALTASNQGELLVSASGYGDKMDVWQTRSGKRLYTLSARPPLAASTAGNTLVTASFEGVLKIWNLNGGVLLRTMALPGGSMGAIAIAPDGRILATGSWDGTVYLWQLLSGQAIGVLRHDVGGSRMAALAFSPDGRTLASVCHGGRVKLWAWQEARVLREFSRSGDRASCLAFSPAGDALAVGGWDGYVDLWRAIL